MNSQCIIAFNVMFIPDDGRQAYAKMRAWLTQNSALSTPPFFQIRTQCIVLLKIIF